MAKKCNHSFQLIAQNIGPHSNLNENLNAGDAGQIRIGIFASNGGGKSSLSRQFRLLSMPEAERPISNKYLSLGEQQGEFKFKLFQQDNPGDKSEVTIIYKRNEQPIIKDDNKLIYHVFNSDYVRESIEPQNFGQNNKIEGYIIGKTAVDLSTDKITLERLSAKSKAIKGELQEGIKSAHDELKSHNVRANTAEFKSITFESLIANSIPSNGDGSFHNVQVELKKLQGIPDDINDIPVHKSYFETNYIVIKEIVENLNTNISISELSEEFKRKIRSKEKFIVEGVKLLGNKYDVCPFCEQDLEDKQNDLINDFIKYINDAETIQVNKLKNNITQICTLKNLFENKLTEFIKIQSAYNNIRDYFPSYKNKDISNIKKLDIDWNEIVETINIKIDNISINVTSDKIERIEKTYKSVVEYQTQIISLCEHNNKLINSINHEKNNTRDELLRLRRTLSRAKHVELYDSFATKIIEFNETKLAEKEKEKEIQSAESKEKILKKDIYTDTFDNLLKFVFNDKYIYNKENSCLKLKEHSLKTNANDILSDGEKNIIAFCCYIAETHTIINTDSDYNNLFFVIDDPISSMDFHYTYTLCRILERLEDAFPSMDRIYLRFIVFTHNIEFMSILLRNNSIRQKFVLTHSELKKLNKELVMPYHEHLSDIYKVASHTMLPTHTTPNSMRNILETVAKFENPEQSLISYIEDNTDLNRCSSLHNMFQDLSHGIFRSQTAILPDDVIKGCEIIIEFMKVRYSGQIKNVTKTI